MQSISAQALNARQRDASGVIEAALEFGLAGGVYGIGAKREVRASEMKHRVAFFDTPPHLLGCA
ncbi:MAG: hypothetical protein R8G34_09110 [Paracoccaceae bacterium]|nr:hypothetical protein [Paracoccaceae bacterium]